MQTDFCSREKDGIGPALLVVDGAEWRFCIVGVDRIGPALVVRIVLSGPEECAVAVQISGNYIIGTTAMQILDSVCAWLLSREGQTEGVIDIGTNCLPAGRAPLAH